MEDQNSVNCFTGTFFLDNGSSELVQPNSFPANLSGCHGDTCVGQISRSHYTSLGTLDLNVPYADGTIYLSQVMTSGTSMHDLKEPDQGLSSSSGHPLQFSRKRKGTEDIPEHPHADENINGQGISIQGHSNQNMNREIFSNLLVSGSLDQEGSRLGDGMPVTAFNRQGSSREASNKDSNPRNVRPRNMENHHVILNSHGQLADHLSSCISENDSFGRWLTPGMSLSSSQQPLQPTFTSSSGFNQMSSTSPITNRPNTSIRQLLEENTHVQINNFEHAMLVPELGKWNSGKNSANSNFDDKHTGQCKNVASCSQNASDMCMQSSGANSSLSHRIVGDSIDDFVSGNPQFSYPPEFTTLNNPEGYFRSVSSIANSAMRISTLLNYRVPSINASSHLRHFSRTNPVGVRAEEPMDNEHFLRLGVLWRRAMLPQVQSAVELFLLAEQMQDEDSIVNLEELPLDDSLSSDLNDEIEEQWEDEEEEDDMHEDMRLDVDDMSYEELLALEERIGFVNTGLNDEAIVAVMKQHHYKAPSVTTATDHGEVCCICLDEYIKGQEIGRLDCSHYFHVDCIKKWLNQRNSCPICKMTALAK